MAKGIIRDNPSETAGKVMVIVPEDGFPHVRRNSVLSYLADPALNLRAGDVVDIRLGPDHWCGINSKLTTPKGTITKFAFDGRGGEVMITDPDPNDFGVNAGDTISFNFLTNENPPPNQNGDSIQVIVDGAGTSVFIKVI